MEPNEVTTLHACYEEVKTRREIYADVMKGVDELVENADRYLPKFPAEHEDDYQYRKDTATLVNYTEKTRDKMSGLVFQNPIELQSDVLPEISASNGLWENIDNRGTHGDVFWRDVFDDSFEGYVAVVTDSPDALATSDADRVKLGLRPFCQIFTADQIINWRYRINDVSKALELSLIVFSFVTEEAVGTFGTDLIQRYKAYWLDGSGVVNWARFKEEKVEGSNEIKIIKDGDGTLPALSQIPVALIGCLGDDSPLLEIARKTVEHFQTYSDYKSIIHKTCVPQRVIEGGSSESVAPLSGSVTLFPPTGHKAYFIEVEGKGIAAVRQSLRDIQDDIELMGVSLLADKKAAVDKTATQSMLDDVGESAPIRVMARELQDAIELTFGFFAEFFGRPKQEGGSVIMGTKWDAAKKAQEQIAANTNNDNTATPMPPSTNNVSEMMN